VRRRTGLIRLLGEKENIIAGDGNFTYELFSLFAYSIWVTGLEGMALGGGMVCYTWYGTVYWRLLGMHKSGRLAFAFCLVSYRIFSCEITVLRELDSGECVFTSQFSL